MGTGITTTGTIAKGAYVSEWKRVSGNRWVNKYSILGTTVVCYVVWEPMRGSLLDHSHSTITTHEGVWMGDITTRELPADIDALPAYTDERLQAVRAWFAVNEAEACAAVLEAYPELHL